MSADVYCRAALNYTGDSSATHEGAFPPITPIEVDILDGRLGAKGFSWSTQGFELMQHESVVADWGDAKQVAEVYVPEMEALARTITSCDFALSTPPLHRTPENRSNPIFAPVIIVHSDYSREYREMVTDPTHPYMKLMRASMRRRDVGFDDIGAARRIVSLHFWRNIGPRSMDYPMCFCDSRTVEEDELYPLLIESYTEGYAGPEQISFKTTMCRASDAVARHRWYTFPEMSPDEILVFQSYDTDAIERGEPYWSVHSAFRDPTKPADVAPRESIEMRVLCGFAG